MRDVDRRRVVVEGVAIELHELGAGEPVVLLHGLLGSPAYLAPLARVLARDGRRVLMPELFGHGGSDRLRPFSFDARRRPAGGGRRPISAGAAGRARPLASVHRWPCTGRPGARSRSLVAASPVGVAPLEVGWTRHLLPVAPAVAAIARRAAPLAASTAIGRRFVFGWFVGMRRPQAVEPALGERLIRGAAAAASCLTDVLPELAHLGLDVTAAEVRCRSLTIWGDRDPHGLANGAELADGPVRRARRAARHAGTCRCWRRRTPSAGCWRAGCNL